MTRDGLGMTRSPTRSRRISVAVTSGGRGWKHLTRQVPISGQTFCGQFGQGFAVLWQGISPIGSRGGLCACHRESVRRRQRHGNERPEHGDHAEDHQAALNKTISHGIRVPHLAVRSNLATAVLIASELNVMRMIAPLAKNAPNISTSVLGKWISPLLGISAAACRCRRRAIATQSGGDRIPRRLIARFPRFKPSRNPAASP